MMRWQEVKVMAVKRWGARQRARFHSLMLLYGSFPLSNLARTVSLSLGSRDEEEEEEEAAKAETWSSGGGVALYVEELLDFDAPFNCRLSLKDFDTLIHDLDRELAKQINICL